MATNQRRRAGTIATPPEVMPSPAKLAGVERPAGQKFAFHPVETTVRLPPFTVAPLVPPMPVVHSGHVDPNTPIGQRYAALGGTGALGEPFFDQRPTPDGRGVYQAYDQGAIFYAAAYGAVVISRAIYLKWDGLASATTQSGDNMRVALHLPTEDAANLAGNVQIAYFEQGMIVVDSHSNAYAVYGPISGHYRQLRDVHGVLGLPVSDEQPLPKGRCSRFEHGDIYWSASTGAQAVQGMIRTHWLSRGGPGGLLGFPKSDEDPVLHSGKEIGRCEQFEGGWIYWSPGSGAWEVHGDIRRAWIDRFGGPSGALGFPISDETPSPSGHARYNNFQHGCLIWRGSYDSITCVTSMDVFLEGFNSKGHHTWAERHLGYPIWLYVFSSVHASTGQSASVRFPNRGHYGGPSAMPTQSLLKIPVVRGELVIDVSFDGWDAATWGDVHLSTIRARYSIDNLWGQGEDPQHWNGDFMASYSLRAQSPVPAGAQFRTTYFWKFDNPGTPELTRDQFAQTFYDVQEDESSSWHWFDDLYYEHVYKGIAANGYCFGMCLESVYAQLGRSLFPEPIYTVNRDSDHAPVVNQIDIKHGYQAGAAMIDWFIAKFLAGQTHDPVRAFRESRDQYLRGDYPILSITKDYLGSEAHAVRPYAWNDRVTPWTISIANPNDPAGGQDFAQEDMLTIDPAHNSFRFVFAQLRNEVWSGDAWSGARMFSVPYSLFAQRPRTPFWEIMFGALAAVGLVMIIMGDTASTRQITDEQGRMFFEPAAAGTDRRLLLDPARRIPGLAVAPIIHRARTNPGRRTSGIVRRPPGVARRPKASSVPELYYVKRGPGAADSALHFEVSGKNGADYQWTAASQTILASARLQGAAVSDRLSLEGLGSANAAVTVTPGEKTQGRQVALTLAGRPPRPNDARTFEVTKLTMTPGKPVRMQVEDAGKSLRIENSGHAASFDLRLYAHRDPKAALVRNDVKLEPKSTVSVRPVDWSAAELGRTKLEISVRDNAGKVVRHEHI
jgi:LGFP repeat-containing protein